MNTTVSLAQHNSVDNDYGSIVFSLFLSRDFFSHYEHNVAHMTELEEGQCASLKSLKVKALTLARLEPGESVLKAGDTELSLNAKGS